MIDMLIMAKVSAESSHTEKSNEVSVLPKWLLDAAIDVEETVKEILEKRNSE